MHMSENAEPTPTSDSQFELLATISHRIKSVYERPENPWEDSPFGWIRNQPSRRVGMIAEQLVAEWATENGFHVEKSPDSDADRIISGARVEIKSSTLWEAGGYKFQQLRDQNYSIVLCLGLSPFSAHCWALPKQAVLEAWRGRFPGIGSQHGGQSGTDTAWLAVDPDAAPAWLQTYGGALQSGLDNLSNLLTS